MKKDILLRIDGIAAEILFLPAFEAKKDCSE
jgi:hypothetical protein